MAFWSRTKPIDAGEHAAHHQLKRSLDWPHLVALGVGAIVGTGIYALVGIAAGTAGPAVLLSFAIVGVVCACVALSYAEMATMIPASGSAYTYTYSALGELLAWIIGWALILEYSVAASAVAVGWSGYMTGFLESIGTPLPAEISAGPTDAEIVRLLQQTFGVEIGYVAGDAAQQAGGLVNLPAIVIILIVTGLLVLGARESANVNNVLVVIKLIALAAFIVLALPHFNSAHFEPFMPFGFGSTPTSAGVNVGVMAAAAIIFFAFYGFDAVSTAAEETKNPGRDLVIGIVGSMLVCTVLYVAVAAAALGAMAFTQFAPSREPLAFILQQVGQSGAAGVIRAAVIVAVPSVIVALMYGQSRIFFVMARDGLLPQGMGRVHAKFGTPVAMTILVGMVCSVIAGFLPLRDIALLANAGTLAAFAAVSVSVLVMRVREPGRARPFKTPIVWVIAPIAILGCLYLFTSLTQRTIIWFFVWMGIGLVVYFLYGVRKSRLAKA
ncbi:MAG: amino acid permease [Hyphomonadaceae bacterium]|nr:amino acid permease [Hyphomonadaceae bacterium]